MTRWSRFWMCPQTVFAKAMAFLTRPVGFETRIHVPEHARSLFAAGQSRLPLLAETNFVEPMKAGDSRDEQRQRQKRSGRWFFLQQAAGEGKDVEGDFCEAAILAVNNAVAGAQAGEVFFDCTRSGDFRKSLGHSGK